MRIEIERIVLTDLEIPPGREEWLRRRIATELEDLLKSQEWKADQTPPRGERVQAPPLQSEPGAEPTRLAKAVAKSVFLGLGGKL